jgi:hypothetical protein
VPACDTTGTCVVAAPDLSRVLLVIDLASDSYFAPGRTFVVPHDKLYDATSTTCMRPTCGHLSDDGVVIGNYVMSACVQLPSCLDGVGYNLGNNSGGAPLPTALPVTATYRMLQDPWQDDVTSLALPIESVQAQPYVIEADSDPGPAGGPSFGFQTYLQAGGVYERTIVPDPPYDAIFAPRVETVTVAAGNSFSPVPVPQFDVTNETGKGRTLPTFNIGRAQGLDGWTAYLRDETTLETISNVRPLNGTLAQGVLLVTFLPAPPNLSKPPDPLANAELVVRPPSGQPIPTAVFPNQAQELSADKTYPDLPPPVELSGQVVSVDGTPLDADLTFEALAILAQNVLNDTNFEFTGYASTRPSTGSSASRYDVVLPPGHYRVDVRPVDPSSALTFVDLIVDATSSPITQPFSAGATRIVRGQALLADLRPLSEAAVEAVPTQCYAAPIGGDAGGSTTPTAAVASSPSCLPRPAWATTGPDGSFFLSLDPGGYVLRARPADGTRLPWVTQALNVQPASMADTLPDVTLTVPAPVSAGMQLFDPTVVNPIVHAVVRAFAAPSQNASGPSTSQAIEIGQAITGVDGRFDLYLAPRLP